MKRLIYIYVGKAKDFKIENLVVKRGENNDKKWFYKFSCANCY